MSCHLKTVATVPSTHLFVSQSAEQISVQHNGREFFIVDSNNIKASVSNINLSKELRGISSEELKKALDVGYLAVSKVGEEYAIRFNVRLAGGGFGLGALVYGVTTVVGGAMFGLGVITLPLGGVGAGLMAGGTAVVGAAPWVAAAAVLAGPV